MLSHARFEIDRTCHPESPDSSGGEGSGADGSGQPYASSVTPPQILRLRAQNDIGQCVRDRGLGEVDLAPGLLPGVRVLDLGQRISGPYCAKLLAQLGAEVIKVEPPDGDEARRMGPFPGDVPHPEKSGLFLALNANKHGVTLDLTSKDDLATLRKLAKTADMIVENLRPGLLDELDVGYESLRYENPGLIFTSITPFGDWGPYADYKATDLVLFHMSGHAHGITGAVEDPDSLPPVRAGGHQSELVAGLAASTATVMALFRRRMTGRGRRIVLSSFEAMVTQSIAGLANCAYGVPTPPRDLKEVREAATGGMVRAIGGVLPCNDGYVAISPREDAQWERWLELMGNPEWAAEERFATRDAREVNTAELWELLGQWSRNYSKFDIARWGQERRIPCFPSNTVADLLASNQLEHREFFVEMDHPVAGKLKYPGSAARPAGTPLPLGTRPAPLLGQDNDRIFAELGR